MIYQNTATISSRRHEMDNNKATTMLDNLRFIRAQAEFKTMLDSLKGSDDENLESILRHRELMLADKQMHEISIALEKYKASNIKDGMEKSLNERLNAAKDILIARQIKDIEASLELIDAWLDTKI
jgi:hypothetical protein